VGSHLVRGEHRSQHLSHQQGCSAAQQGPPLRGCCFGFWVHYADAEQGVVERGCLGEHMTPLAVLQIEHRSSQSVTTGEVCMRVEI
jgi:hypothetical protein